VVGGGDDQVFLHLFDQARGFVLADAQFALNERGGAFGVFG
jgi:hypothetical protein